MKEITLEIFRYDPDKGESPYFKKYKVPIKQGTTILDSLNYIKDNKDRTLTFRQACRSAICGSCAVKVNGKSMLACKTQLSEIYTGGIIKIEPLGHLGLIKDLVVDQKEIFEIKGGEPWITLDRSRSLPKKEFLISPREIKELKEVRSCIFCGSCYSECNAIEGDANSFTGPHSLMKTMRFLKDSRDDNHERIKQARERGLYRCIVCHECEPSCPKNIDIGQNVIDIRYKAAKSIGPLDAHKKLMQNIKGDLYLFNWNEIPGNDNERLIEFIKQNFGVKWVKTAKIKKIDHDRTIEVSTEKNFLSLRLNDEKTKVNLKIDDTTTDEYIASLENDKLNIYGVTDYTGCSIAKTDIPTVNLYPEYIKTFKDDPQAEVVLFLGCILNHRQPNVAKSIINILQHNNIAVHLPKEQVCCGSPEIRTGQKDEVLPFIQKNFDIFESYIEKGIDNIVTSCPGCCLTLRNNYPDLSREVGVSFKSKVYDVTEFLSKKVELKEFTEKIEAKVMYHYPCHTRKMGLNEDLYLELLQKIPGVEISKVSSNRLCCGGGGGVRIAYPELNKTLSKRRLQAAIEKDVDLLVTNCPFCYISFDTAIKDSFKEVKFNLESYYNILSSGYALNESNCKDILSAIPSSSYTDLCRNIRYSHI